MATDPKRSDDESDDEQIEQHLPRRGRSEADAAPERATQGERSYRELYTEAKARSLPGRSTMSKEELERRLSR